MTRKQSKRRAVEIARRPLFREPLAPGYQSKRRAVEIATPPAPGRSPGNQRAAQIARRLAKAYPDATCSLVFHSPLELLVATILSAQCTDQRVNQVTGELFRKYRSAADYAGAGLADLERDIQSTGFFATRPRASRTAVACCWSSYDGQLPATIEELVELPGVGRKTANVVLGTALGIASGVVVDTHVARISRRLGLSPQRTPAKSSRT